MRNMSFSITTQQMRERKKTVTRRMGWSFLKEGEIIAAIEKGQGLKKGEKVVHIGKIKIISIRAEYLSEITLDEVKREGFPEMNVPQFIHMFCKANHCEPHTLVNRIEFERID